MATTVKAGERYAIVGCSAFFEVRKGKSEIEFMLPPNLRIIRLPPHSLDKRDPKGLT